MELASGGGHEDGVRLFELPGQKVLFGNRYIGELDPFEENFARDAGKAAGVEGRGDDGISEDGEEVGGGAFADAAVFVEEDDFVVAALAGFFVPGEILGPGGDFRAGEFVGAVAGVRLPGEAGPGAPVGEVLGERDDVVGTGLVRGVEGTAGVAEDGDAEGGVGRAIGGDEAEEIFVESVWRGREGDMHSGGVAGHAGPVAFKGEEDAVEDPERGKDAPTVEDADLAGGEKAIGGVAQLVVIEQGAMHPPIVTALL